MPRIRILGTNMQTFERSGARNVRFDWAVAIAAFWTTAGMFADVAWHIRHHVDSLFTPSHALLFSGLAVLFAIYLITALSSAARGERDWRLLLPPGHAPSLAGILCAVAGGISDLLKHEAFGFERDFDALLSPTHLLLGIGVLIVLAGALRSALYEVPRPRTLGGQIPLLISAACILELLHWETNPFFRIDAQRAFDAPIPRMLGPDAFTLQTLHDYHQGQGMLAVLLQSLLMMAVAFYLLRNFRLRPGAFTLFFVLGNGLIDVSNSVAWTEAIGLLTASVVSGVVADAFFLPGDELRLNRLRIAVFAFFVPAIYHATFLIYASIALGGIWWDPSIAAGTIVVGGIFSLLLSIVAMAGPLEAGSGSA